MLDKKLPNSSQNDDVSDDELTLSEVGNGALSEFQRFIEANRKTMDRLTQDHLQELFKDFPLGNGGSRNTYN